MLKEIQRLEEEEDKVMREILELQAQILRIREAKKRLNRRPKDSDVDRPLTKEEEEELELAAQRAGVPLYSDDEQ